MNACPCGSDLSRTECCQPIIDGTMPAPSAEAVMRARYTAYVNGDIDFIIDSNHADTRDGIEREDVERWSQGSEWLGLRILDVEGGQAGDDTGVVRFRARYRMDGQLHTHRERAHFARDEAGAWKFHTAEEDADEAPELVPVTPRAQQVGRNDPCPCGSGAKFKKCCG